MTFFDVTTADDWLAESDWLEQLYQERADIFDALGYEVTDYDDYLN